MLLPLSPTMSKLICNFQDTWFYELGLGLGLELVLGWGLG
jgi:hypothetical protein